MKNKKRNYWQFIEDYLPNYYSREDVLWSDILIRFIENEELDDSDLLRIENEIGLSKKVVLREFKKNNKKLLLEAFDEYFKETYKF